MLLKKGIETTKYSKSYEKLKLETPPSHRLGMKVSLRILAARRRKKTQKRKMDWDSPFAPIFRLFAAENLPLRISSVVFFRRFFRF
jgi:hypothetical protein